jgi:hypothetical protein
MTVKQLIDKLSTLDPNVPVKLVIYERTACYESGSWWDEVEHEVDIIDLEDKVHICKE